jgi:hypothetical protein
MNVPPAAPRETANFHIGGQDIAVPALTLYVMDRTKDAITALSPDLGFTDYAKRVIEIVSVALEDSRPELTAEALARVCSFPDMRDLPSAMNELLRVSGFLMGEAEAASPGTGTSTSSSPNSEQETSVAATSDKLQESLL